MKKFVWFLAVSLVLVGSGSVWAEGMSGKCERGDASCPMMKGSGKMGGEEAMESPCPIARRLMKTAHAYLEHKDELGLSEEQVSKIKEIKTLAKKNAIQQGADMQVFMVDMEAKLSDQKIDVEALNAMIDQGSVQMSKGAKETLQQYVQLKAVLSPEQQTKLKDLYKKS